MADVEGKDWVTLGGLRRIDRRTVTEGWVRFPAIPQLLDLYVRRLVVMWAAMGKRFDKDEIVTLRNLIEPRMRSAWNESPHAKLTVSWKPEEWPQTGIEYTVSVETTSTASQYAGWVDHKEPPFGPYPDSRAVHVAKTLGPPADAPVLDIGAGVGRNALPLARLGHPVIALDLTPEFCAAMERSAEEEGLSVQVVGGNVVADEPPDLPSGHFALVLASEVTSHFRSAAEMRRFVERCAGWLRPGGVLLANAFLGDAGFDPPAWLRQASEIHWSWFLLRKELDEVLEGLPMQLEEEHNLYEYEQEHYPGEWPPTSWYHDWTHGYDVVRPDNDERPPFRMRWLTIRRS